MPEESAPYLLGPRFFLKTTTFGYAQPWWATVNHSQSGYGLFFYKTLKRYQKKPFFGPFWKPQWVKLAKYYLKSTTRQYWIRISFYFHWKTLFLTYFLVYCKFLLYQSGTIVCPFLVVLKHKCILYILYAVHTAV